MNFSLRDVTRATMDAFLPRGSGENKGLLLRFSFRASVYLDYADLLPEYQNLVDAADEDDGVYEQITEGFTVLQASLLLMRPMNYTRVLIRRANGVANDLYRISGSYQETSYHDSAWDDGLREFDTEFRALRDALVSEKSRFLRPGITIRPSINNHLHDMRLIGLDAVVENETTRMFSIIEHAS